MAVRKRIDKTATHNREAIKAHLLLKAEMTERQIRTNRLKYLHNSKKSGTFAAMLGKRCAIWILVIVYCAGMWSCSSHRLEEAQATVATADSLWHNGQCLSDSAQLAQAYHTLHRRRAVYPDEYAHACYHYGKLLRAKDDPVAAMQCFINASHSRTHDYHILGRIYSNMGSICHLAGEYALSYDMYERSANVFLQDRDTLSYYYLLNDMALEQAVLGKKDTACLLLSLIENSSKSQYLLPIILETKAEACLYAQQYDSAIYYATQAHLFGNYEASCVLLIAQSYSLRGIQDSATYYAEKVRTMTNSLMIINNALYILTNDDDTKDSQTIRKIAAERADVQKLLEIRQGKLSQAVQLLEQDIHRKPNWEWVYATIVTLLLVAISIGVYSHRKRKQHRLLSQQLADLTSATSDIREKHKELTARYQTDHERMEDEIKRKCVVMRSDPNLAASIEWARFDSMCHQIDRHFYGLASLLLSKHILNETEIRLCILVLLDMSRAEIANMLPYALNSVGKLKDHTAKKLGTTGKNLRNFLFLAVIEG